MEYLAEIQLVTCVNVPQLGVIHSRAGEVCKEHTESDGEQEQRLELMLYRKVHKHKCNQDHNNVLPLENGKA